MTDFGEQLHDIAAIIEHPVKLHGDTIAIAEEGLQSIETKHGVDSPDPLSYHNAPHGIDHIRRQVRLTNLLYPYLSPYYRRGIYDLNFVGGAWHDEVRELGPVENEEASAANGAEALRGSDDRLLSSDLFASRFSQAIMATVVEFDEDMRMSQPNLRTGSQDPIKFITAFADVNGIAMEGSATMLRDAINLAVEMNPDAGPKDIFDFMCSQAKYLKHRLNDNQIKPDIAYYFPNSSEEVYQAMRRAFRPNIVSAYSLANGLQSAPELKEVIGRSLDVAGKLPPGEPIGRAVIQYLQRSHTV